MSNYGKRKRPEAPYITLYLICTNKEVAKTLAQMMLKMRLRSLYADDKICHLAYEQQPAPMRHRYFPFKVYIYPDGEIISCKSLIRDMENEHYETQTPRFTRHSDN